MQFLERGLHFLYGILHRLTNFFRGKILSTLKVIFVTLFLKISILKSNSIFIWVECNTKCNSKCRINWNINRDTSCTTAATNVIQNTQSNATEPKGSNHDRLGANILIVFRNFAIRLLGNNLQCYNYQLSILQPLIIQ